MTEHQYDGMDARACGKSLSENPHPKGTAACEDWKKGFETMDLAIRGLLSNARHMIDGLRTVRTNTASALRPRLQSTGS